MINSVADGESEDVVDVSDLVAKLSSISKGEPAPAAAPTAAAPAAAAPAAASSGGMQLTDIDRDMLRQAKEGGMIGVHVQITLAETCLLKSARSYMVMNALDEIGTAG